MSHHIYQCPHYWDAPERHWVCTACVSGANGLKDATEALVTAMDLTKKNKALTAERDSLQAELGRLSRETDRLRAALEKIANPGYWMTGDEATQRARAALAEANASGEDA